MLPLKAPAAQPPHRHKYLDGVLRHDGGDTGRGLPGEGPAFFRVPSDDIEGQQDQAPHGPRTIWPSAAKLPIVALSIGE